MPWSIRISSPSILQGRPRHTTVIDGRVELSELNDRMDLGIPV